MACLEISGGKPLVGRVAISGSKNAAVAVIPAAVCLNDVCVIENLPAIEDVRSLIDTLTNIGVNCELTDQHNLKVDSRGLSTHRAVGDSIKKLRASYYLIGALLGRLGEAEVALPGGCNFGSRPIDQHIKGFEAMGASFVTEHGIVKAKATKLTGAHIYLDVASVGATINIMLAAVYAEGQTTIENAAREPHVVDTANFLNMMGAQIKGAGTDIIKITGIERLHGGNYTIIPDQIEAGTYMIAGAITNGDLTVENVIPKHMDSLSAKLREMNCDVAEGDDYIRVCPKNALTGVHVKTMVYPGFPTDLQPQMATLLSISKGSSLITETVFENRFQYVNELNRLGAGITIEGRTAYMEGGARLTGCDTTATDLRAGAALVIGGLAAQGVTKIGNVKYIDRGYELIETKLAALGADVRRVEGEQEEI